MIADFLGLIGFKAMHWCYGSLRLEYRPERWHSRLLLWTACYAVSWDFRREARV